MSDSIAGNDHVCIFLLDKELLIKKSKFENKILPNTKIQSKNIIYT